MVAGKKLTCHVAKKSPHICTDHMAKAKISSTIVFKCTDEAVKFVGSRDFLHGCGRISRELGV